MSDAAVSPELSPVVPSQEITNMDRVTYTDPSADVSLVGEEGRVFKVHSYFLKAHSSHFRDLSSGNGHTISATNPIKIPAKSSLLKAWLDLAHLRNLPPKMIWSIRDPLFKLCDHLGSPGVAERALFAMQTCMDEKDPWKIFALASQRNNVGLARAALRTLGEENVGSKIHVEHITQGLAVEVTLPYLLGIYTAALQVKAQRTNGGQPNGRLTVKEHDDLADLFNSHTNGHPNGHVTNARTNWHGAGADKLPPISWKAIADKFHPITG